MLDRLLGNYRIVRALGEGGMGAVYEARHEQIGRRAAIKVLHAELARNPDIAMRFMNEARAANMVQHPGIVDIYELGQTPDGSAYIVMQYLEGDSLRGRLKRLGKLGPDAVRLGRQIASALAAAHEQKIVHRDLKPENIMIVADPEAPGGERAKVLDFGIAKLAAELKAPGEMATRTGALMGTPAYMAPEQCRGLTDLNDRADVYSLGVLLFEMVAGEKPFKGDMGELIAAHLYKAPPPLPAPRPLNDLVQRMLAKTSAERPSMREVVAALESQPGTRSSSPRLMTPALAQSTDATLHSTLGTASGQVQFGSRRWQKLVWAGVAVVLLAGGARLALRPRDKARETPVGAAAVHSEPSAPALQPPPHQPTPVAPAPPAPTGQIETQQAGVTPAVSTGPKKKIRMGSLPGKPRQGGKTSASLGTTPQPALPVPAPKPAAQPTEEEYVPKRLH